MVWVVGALLVAGYTGNLVLEAWRAKNPFAAVVLAVFAIASVAMTAWAFVVKL